MRSGTPGFQPERLTEAREARGITQVELAKRVDRNKSTISKWEKGDQKPDQETLERLAKIMNVRSSYFLLPTPEHGDRPQFFRSMASTTLSARKKAHARLRWLQDISLALQERIDFPPVDIPTCEKTDHEAISNVEIERLAEKCRRHWMMGDGPISDMMLVLENAGAIVAYDELDSAKMDGLSNWSDVDGRPYVLLASDKSTCVRSRMDAAHELGHLVLHRHVDTTTLNKKADFKLIETQAFAFASAFLMPAESFADEITFPSLDGLLALKERWRVSVAAMIMRCRRLNIIDDDYATQLYKNKSRRGWTKQEPLDDKLEVERPRLLERSIKLLIEENVLEKGMILDELRLSSRDVEELTGLTGGYLNTSSAEVSVLPRLKKGHSEAPNDNQGPASGGSNVVSFPKAQRKDDENNH